MFKQEIHNGVMQKCSLKVHKRWFGDRKYDMIWVADVVKEEKQKKSSKGRLAVDSRE